MAPACPAALLVTTRVLELSALAQAGDEAARAELERLAAMMGPR